MGIQLDTLLSQGKFDVVLDVIDPNTSGSTAGIGARGKSLDDGRWIKTGSADTDWERFLISNGGVFDSVVKLKDSTDTVLPTNTIGQSGNFMTIGDGSTVGGIVLNDATQTVAYTTTAGVLEQINGDIPENFSGGSYSGFSPNTTFKSLIIGNSCKTIGSSAFEYCTGLIGDLTISDSVTTIEDNAFLYCWNTGLRKLTIGDSVTTIGSQAFKYASFTSLTLGESVTTIGSTAFDYCQSFRGDLIIPDSVESIGNTAFYNCGFDGDLIIGDSVRTLEYGAFSDCGFTGTLTLGNSVETIGESCFGYVPFTGTLTIPESVTSMGDFAFTDCSSLTQVDCYTSRSVIDSFRTFWNSGIVGITGSAELGFTAGADTIGGKAVTVTLR